MGDAALKEELRKKAEALGFARMTVAQAGYLEEEAAQLRAFLQAGYHGSMGWLADTAEGRADPRHEGMLPEARSVVVLAVPYARSPERIGPAPGRIARYARGRDYHNALRKPLKKLEAFLRERGHATRYSVDSRPVYERAWAERSGMGFVGKNACLIIPGVGSHVFLATLVTAAELPTDAPMKRRCGKCTLCLDACPTEAFVAPRRLDGRKCISYLTIERRDELEPAFEASMGDWVLGCDVCQDVCPYNRTSLFPETATADYAPSERWDTDAEAILAMDEATFDRWASGSPAKRPGRGAMARNAAIMLGNVGEKRHLPVLQTAFESHDNEMVRRTAFRAMARLKKRTDA